MSQNLLKLWLEVNMEAKELESFRCVKCDKPLYAINDDIPVIQGHYTTPNGNYCLECYEGVRK